MLFSAIISGSECYQMINFDVPITPTPTSINFNCHILGPLIYSIPYPIPKEKLIKGGWHSELDLTKQSGSHCFPSSQCLHLYPDCCLGQANYVMIYILLQKIMLEDGARGTTMAWPHCACHGYLGSFSYRSRCHVFIGSPYPHCASSTEPHAPNIHNMTIQKSTSYIYISAYVL